MRWAIAGLLIWITSSCTCFTCVDYAHIDNGYSQHESARGTTERSP